MANWPETTRLIGTNIPRIDGMAKASGRAKYPSDERPEGMLFGVVVYSPYAHAKITSIDTSKAEKMPGVKGVELLARAGSTMRFHGDDIAVVAAETEEQARDAARAIEIKYEVLPHAVTEEQSMARGAPQVMTGQPNVTKGRAQVTGNPDDAIAKSDFVIEGTYSVPVITHVCLEPHGLCAKWESDDKLTAWASTQSVMGAAGELAESFKIPTTNVEVRTSVMGGGFGSKFRAESWGVAAARLAKKAGKPVTVFLDRAQEHMSAGNRPSASATIKIGANKDGKLTAVIADCHGTGGFGGGANVNIPYVYASPTKSLTNTAVRVNGGGQRAMRAPGHPQACALTEAAMDDLADKMGIDPLTFRLDNLAPGDFRTKIYRDEVAMGAKLIGWENRKPRGQNGKGPVKRGYGMALHQWGGGGAPDKQVTCNINPDGSVELKSATQDIGTGARTILAIIAAELLGLEVKDIKSNIGNSTFPPGQSSGGSTTSPSMAPPCYNAVTQARDALLSRVAQDLKVDAGQLTLKDGQVFVGNDAKMSFKDACRKLGTMPISVTAGVAPGLASNGVGGAQFAEVEVDTETGVVRVKKIVAIQDSGLILDMLTWKSQVYGGVIGGLNYGLFEERIMDPGSGKFLNADMEMYKLAGASDIPEIIVEAYQPDEQKKRGVIGVGEPPTIGTAAAIGNAVTNAIGVRVPNWPMSPMNVLNALAKASSTEGKA
jgi:xanthine dehydrogenase YagR molybdenum-binding subunit